jgi:hypothetical protein
MPALEHVPVQLTKALYTEDKPVPESMQMTVMPVYWSTPSRENLCQTKTVKQCRSCFLTTSHSTAAVAATAAKEHQPCAARKDPRVARQTDAIVDHRDSGYR